MGDALQTGARPVLFSGKTTLLRAIIGAIAPSGGHVRRTAGLRVGYTPQKLAIERTVPITVEQMPEVSDHDYMKQQERSLLAMCVRTMALPIGRGEMNVFCSLKKYF